MRRLSAQEVAALYRQAAESKGSIATADAIIGTPARPYAPDQAHCKEGQDVKAQLVRGGWTFRGEMQKTVNGNPTTVGVYTKD